MRSALFFVFCLITVGLRESNAHDQHAHQHDVANTGAIHGECYFDDILGSPSVGVRWLYETNLFLSPTTNPTKQIGPSRRLGAPPGHLPTYDGRYNISNLPTGSYSAYVAEPTFFIRPKVSPHITIKSGQDLKHNISLNLDYSSHVLLPNQWPKKPEVCWYQTFEATGINVVGASINFAGLETKEIAVSVVEGTGNITKWNAICKRGLASFGKDTDSWTKWRSGECPTKPGKEYAIAWCTTDGGGMQPYWRKKDHLSYKHGNGWDSSGNALDFDITAVVFTDNDGTILTVRNRDGGNGILKNNWFSTMFGQTWTAKGTALAAMDVFAAGAAGKWDLLFQWTIHNGSSPMAPQIGSYKETHAAYQAAGFGLHGVSYNPKEIPLIPGRQYTAVWKVINPPPASKGCNTGASPDSGYSGHAWHYDTKTSKWQAEKASADMTVLEYV